MPKHRRTLEHRGLSDSDYMSIMEKVANENYTNWGFNNPDKALLYALNDNTYNYRGYYDKYPKGKGNAIDHWTDEFKTVYHPTFSDESIYSGKVDSNFNPNGFTGGMWLNDIYIPPKYKSKSKIKFDKGGKVKSSFVRSLEAQPTSKLRFGTGCRLQLRDGGKKSITNGLNLFRNTNRAGDVYYTYQNSPDGEEVRLTPLATIGNNPAYWTWIDDTGKVYTPRLEKQTESTIKKDARNVLSRAIGNYFGELKYQADNNIPISGKYTMPAIAMSALLPVAGEAVAGSSIAGVPVTTWADAALTSAFGAHGINHAVNEGINGLGDAAMTALEVTPLGRLAKPIWNVGKDGLQYIAKVADNAARYASPSYDLYRTISGTTPRTTPTYHGFNLNGEQVYTGSPLFEFGQTMRTSPEKAYFMRAPKDVDVLKLGNGKFRHEVVGNETLPSGEVNGKFVSYGEPWKEFALGENSALYEFPVGHRRGQSLIATDWKGRGRKYSVDEVYDYMQQEEALRKELASIKETIGDDFLKQYSTIRRNLINEKYPTLKEHIDTSIYGANQTVIPNEKWNFDRFLKTPFWKYSENPISGQVQKELMIRLPETKPFEGTTAEWTNIARNVSKRKR